MNASSLAKSMPTADGFYMSLAVPNILTMPAFFAPSSNRTDPCFFRDWVGIGGDPRVEDWFLMKSPLFIMFTIAFYVVLLGRLGRRLMQSFEPMEFLKPFIILYNITMLAMNGYIMLEIFNANRILWYSWLCEPLRYGTDKISMRIAAACHLFAITKLIEFLDTVFIIALKNWRQLSFLHLFHHSSMLANGWMIARFFAAGTPVLSVMVNSGIHTMMYSYYALAASASLLQTTRLQMVLYRIKKYITIAQMIQFLVGFTVGCNALFVLRDKCDYPMFVKVLGIIYTAAITGMFSNFYYHAYIKRRQPRPDKRPQVELSAAQEASAKSQAASAAKKSSRQHGLILASGHVYGENGKVRKRIDSGRQAAA